jgi:hypothetical protein
MREKVQMLSQVQRESFVVIVPSMHYDRSMPSLRNFDGRGTIGF